MPNTVTIPSLQGLVPQKVEEHLRVMAQAVNRLGNQTPDTSLLLTKKEAATLYSPSVVRQSLSASGSTPLNISGLPGVVAQPQTTNVPSVTALPTSGPLLQDGVLISFNGLLYRFNGSPAPGTWQVQEALSIILTGLHSLRLTTLTAGYQQGTLFVETDRTSTYLCRATTGIVTTAGTLVTVSSGDMFSTVLIGSIITINGSPYPIVAVPTTLTLTLGSSAGAQIGVPYSSPVLQWMWYSGVFTVQLTSAPTDLTTNDVGFTIKDTQFWRVFQWSFTGGPPTSASPGWNRAMGEVPTGKIDILPFGPGAGGAATITGWSLCNGANVTITQDDGTTTLVTKPNFSGSFPKGGGYSGAVVTPVAPTISGHTDTSNGIFGVQSTLPSAAVITGDTGNDAGAGVVVQSGAGTTVAAHTHVHPTAGTVTDSGHSHLYQAVDIGHQHPLTSANAPIALPGDPVSAILVPFYMKR